MIAFDFQRPINRYNVNNDYNYRLELVDLLILNRMVVFLSSGFKYSTIKYRFRHFKTQNLTLKSVLWLNRLIIYHVSLATLV